MTSEIEGSNPSRGIASPVNLRCSCNTDVVYGLVFNGLLRRLTFSQDLALFIQSKNPNHEIWKLDLVIVGKATKQSTNCIFGIASVKNNKLLRATVSCEEAFYLSDDEFSRYVVECKIKKGLIWKDKIDEE